MVWRGCLPVHSDELVVHGDDVRVDEGDADDVVRPLHGGPLWDPLRRDKHPERTRTGQEKFILQTTTNQWLREIF